MASQLLTLRLEIPDDYRGALIQSCAALNTTEEQIALDSLIFALRRVQGSMPLAGSMLASLETSEAGSQLLRTRINSVLLTAEKALADSTTLVSAAAGVLAAKHSSPQADAPEPKQT